MDVEFADADLDRLDQDETYTAGFPPEVVKGFAKAVQSIQAAKDERDLYRGGLRMEKLKGDHAGHHSVRLNKQWRLIIRLEKKEPTGSGNKAVLLKIEDYH
jgi:proteic killer suppression protein